jgi:hypothetical protein
MNDMKKAHEIKVPQISLRFNKHHVQEFYFLADKNEFLMTPGNNGVLTKRVGPSIIQINQLGVERKIIKHSINSKAVWSLLANYIKAGLWALNDRHVAPLLPADLLSMSLRFFDIDNKRRSRMMNKTSQEVKRRSARKRR